MTMTVAATPALHDPVAKVLAQPSLLSLAYQPIVDVARAEIVGYEVLARLPGAESPAHWFELASRQGQGAQLQMLVLARVVAQLPAVPRGRFLSVNISPEALAEPRLGEIVASAGALARRLVLELTELVQSDDVEAVIAALTPVRAQGVLFAVDEAGAGYEALEQLGRLRPDLVKIRSSLVEGASSDPAKLALAETVASHASKVDAWIVATGLESLDDLIALTRARVPLAQGYLLGRPDMVMTELDGPVVELLQAVAQTPGVAETPAVEHAPSVEQPPISHEGIGQLVHEAEHALAGPAAVLDAAGHVAGVLVPGAPPNARVEPVTLKVSAGTPVPEVARAAMERPIQHRYDPVLVVDEGGHVVGVFGVDDLVLLLADLAEPGAS